MKRILILITILALSIGQVSAKKVSGSVKSGKEAIEGVIVTDGTSFTKTNKQGKFKLKIKDDAEHVYIVTPSGYVADYSSGLPAFFQRTEGVKKFRFNLQKTQNSNDYSIVAIGDPQTKHDKHFELMAGEPMADLVATTTELSKKMPTVGLALGDICWDALYILDKFKEEIKRTGIPFYPVIGNHDHDKDAQGDKATSAIYREKMGPENYAFFIGKDVVIVLDNIIYDTQKKYKEGYSTEVLSWVRGLMRLLPKDSKIYVAQHSPLYRWFKKPHRILNADKLLGIFAGRHVTFISGHTHINNYFEYDKNITEHNVAGFCGAWWSTYHNNDGTPRGYKVFTMSSNKLKWYYKSVGEDKDYQMQVYLPGQTMRHPNSIVANIWDWDPEWKVEWYEDGKPMGYMDQVFTLSPIYIREINARYTDNGKEIPRYKRPRMNNHYFAATPSQYAKNVTIMVKSRFGKQWVYSVDMSDYIDVQAHRGGPGLLPENTIEAMKKALDLGVNTLELDLHVSKDGKVVVSHDAYFHHRYATRPDGSLVQKQDPKEYLYHMTYEEIAKYDVGLRPSEVWPEQENIPAVKPLLSDLLTFVESYTKEKGYSPVRYNIEIKSRNASGEGKNWPAYSNFVDICMRELLKFKLDERLVVQSFDQRALNYMAKKYPEIHFSYLIGANQTDLEAAMAKLDFVPTWISPHYTLVDEEFVAKAHEKGMKIVPWTVDNVEDMQKLIDLRVDAIITNYPDRLLKLTRGYIK